MATLTRETARRAMNEVFNSMPADAVIEMETAGNTTTIRMTDCVVKDGYINYPTGKTSQPQPETSTPAKKEVKKNADV